MTYADVLNLGQKMVEERSTSEEKDSSNTDENEMLKRKVKSLDARVKKLENILAKIKKSSSI
jgi:hypothetical protein